MNIHKVHFILLQCPDVDCDCSFHTQDELKPCNINMLCCVSLALEQWSLELNKNHVLEKCCFWLILWQPVDSIFNIMYTFSLQSSWNDLNLPINNIYHIWGCFLLKLKHLQINKISPLKNGFPAFFIKPTVPLQK